MTTNSDEILEFIEMIDFEKINLKVFAKFRNDKNYANREYMKEAIELFKEELRQKIMAMENHSLKTKVDETHTRPKGKVASLVEGVQNPQDKKGCRKKHVGYYDVICGEDFLCSACGGKGCGKEIYGQPKELLGICGDDEWLCYNCEKGGVK